MYSLAIETANKTLSVAVFQHNQLLSEHTQYDTLQHSVHLVPTVEKVLTEVGISAKDLTNIIVSNGPGSYTGLRIGVTLAKTLAYTLNIPVIPVSSLQVLAQSVTTDEIVIPFFDARRQNVYIGQYCQHQKQQEDSHIAMRDFLQQLSKDKNYVFASPDIEQYKMLILEYLPSATCLECYPSASNMIMFQQVNEPVDAHILTPFYVNKVEAEVNWEVATVQQVNENLVERKAF